MGNKRNKKTAQAQGGSVPTAQHAFELPDGHHVWGSPGHSNNGFEKDGGAIILSPARVSLFKDISAQREGVDALIQATNKFIAGRLAEIAKQQHGFWDLVAQDLGLTDLPERDRLTITGGSCRVTLNPLAPKDEPKT